MGRLQIDHIQPLVKGGVDTEDNLCLACELCNQYKWTQTESLDSESGKTVSLFNKLWGFKSPASIGSTFC
ncbi:HNH endonuclease, partial [Nostoc sp. CCCryo 231-06]|nr:HNH endonuclease [Nostoc sp. CCCryo 231-06]